MSKSSSKSADTPRLQKILASAGFGSRRQCEELILEGRVEIDRVLVEELGTRVDPATQQVRVDGATVKLPRLKHFMLHKPVGVLSTARDPWARTRVIDLVDDPDRLFTVGRLDKSSSGLILVTNDGDLANRLAHPRFGVEKTYRVTVVGKPTNETLKQLRYGVYLSDGKASMERATIKSSRGGQTKLEIVLAEGRNREIRRLLARVGHKVLTLQRIAIGGLRLGDLPLGAYRELSKAEVQQLRKGTSDTSAKTRKKKSDEKPKRRPAAKDADGDKKKPARGKRTAERAATEKPSRGRPAAKRRKPDRPIQGTVLGDDAELEFIAPNIELLNTDGDDDDDEREDSAPVRGKKAGSRKPRHMTAGGSAKRVASKGGPRGGKSSGGRTAGGKASGGKASGGKASGGRASGGKGAGGKSTGGKASTGRNSGGKSPRGAKGTAVKGKRGAAKGAGQKRPTTKKKTSKRGR